MRCNGPKPDRSHSVGVTPHTYPPNSFSGAATVQCRRGAMPVWTLVTANAVSDKRWVSVPKLKHDPRRRCIGQGRGE